MDTSAEKILTAEERLRHVIKATSDVVWEWNIKENILFRGEGFKQLIGEEGCYTIDSYEDWVERVHPDDQERIIEELKDCLNDKNCSKWECSYKYKNAHGLYIFMLDRAFVIRNEDGKAVRLVGAMQNITDLKIKEARELRFQNVVAQLATDKTLPKMKLIDAITKVIRTSAQVLKVERVNTWLVEGKSLCCIASFATNGGVNTLRGKVYTRDQWPNYIDLLKKNRSIVVVNAQEDDRLAELHNTYLKPNNIRSLLDTSIQTNSLQAVVCHESVGEIRDWTPEEIAFVGAITDQVTQLLINEENKEKEKKIRQSLREKETLLAEVHHRVKNNLAFIVGMAQLQSFDEENELVQQKLNSFVTRIKSIAVIHEQLYETEHFSGVEFGQNLKELVSQIVDTLTKKNIEIEYNLSPVELNMSQAIPCSLIVNEVVTNIVKHAFKDKEEGNIKINLYEDQGKIFLNIKDNCRGLPSKFSAKKKHKSLGLDLIQALAEQLEAALEFRSEPEGTLFTINFKKAEMDGSGISSLIEERN